MNSSAPEKASHAITRARGMPGLRARCFMDGAVEQEILLEHTPIWRRSQAGSTWAMSMPSSRIWPFSGYRAAAAILVKVDFPSRAADDADHLPAWMSTETPFRTRRRRLVAEDDVAHADRPLAGGRCALASERLSSAC